jgi:arylmalonate decarboxylase
MYGWRGRIGLLVPAVNTVVEPEFSRLVPEGVGVYAERLSQPRSTELAGNEDLVRDAERAAWYVSRARVGVVAFACTSASFFEGRAAEQRLQDTIAAACGAAAVTAIGAVVEALEALRVRKLVLATPYIDEANALEEAFLAGRGFRVLAMQGLQVREAFEIGLVEDSAVYELARMLVRPDAEAIFISCTNLPTLGVIARLEDDTGLPVVTSNQALAWSCLGKLGVPAESQGMGRLFDIQ